MEFLYFYYISNRLSTSKLKETFTQELVIYRPDCLHKCNLCKLMLGNRKLYKVSSKECFIIKKQVQANNKSGTWEHQWPYLDVYSFTNSNLSKWWSRRIGFASSLLAMLCCSNYLFYYLVYHIRSIHFSVFLLQARWLDEIILRIYYTTVKVGSFPHSQACVI